MLRSIVPTVEWIKVVSDPSALRMGYTNMVHLNFSSPVRAQQAKGKIEMFNTNSTKMKKLFDTEAFRGKVRLCNQNYGDGTRCDA